MSRNTITKLLSLSILLLCVAPTYALERNTCLSNEEPQVILENDIVSLKWEKDATLLLEGKGELAGEAMWRSKSVGLGQSLCRLQDGNLVISRNLVSFIKPVAIDLGLGECLTSTKVLAKNPMVSLIWQTDGNLVTYDAEALGKNRSLAMWSTGTQRKRNSEAIHSLCFKKDGDLVITDEEQEVLWSSQTEGTGAALELGPNCNLQVVNSEGDAVWQSFNELPSRKMTRCNLEPQPLWTAIPMSTQTKAAESSKSILTQGELVLTGCTASIKSGEKTVWQTDTQNCIPTIPEKYGRPNLEFKSDIYYEYTVPMGRYVGAESYSGGNRSTPLSNATPFLRLFEGKRFSYEFVELVNRSLPHLQQVATMDNKTTSLEYRGHWRLCTEPYFKGTCREIKSEGIARIVDIEKAFGAEWNDTISSALLLGFYQTEQEYFQNAAFADTRQVCATFASNPEMENTASAPASYSFDLLDELSNPLYNSAGLPASCSIEVLGKQNTACCNTGYNGNIPPVHVRASADGDSAATAFDSIKTIRITDEKKLQLGLVGEQALSQIELIHEPDSGESWSCLADQQAFCSHTLFNSVMQEME